MLVALQLAARSRFAAWAWTAQVWAHCAAALLLDARDSRHPKHRRRRSYSWQKCVAEARDIFACPGMRTLHSGPGQQPLAVNAALARCAEETAVLQPVARCAEHP